MQSLRDDLRFSFHEKIMYVLFLRYSIEKEYYFSFKWKKIMFYIDLIGSPYFEFPQTKCKGYNF